MIYVYECVYTYMLRSLVMYIEGCISPKRGDSSEGERQGKGKRHLRWEPVRVLCCPSQPPLPTMEHPQMDPEKPKRPQGSFHFDFTSFAPREEAVSGGGAQAAFPSA